MGVGQLPPLKPVLIKARISIIFVEKGEIDVVDGAFVVVDCNKEGVPHTLQLPWLSKLRHCWYGWTKQGRGCPLRGNPVKEALSGTVGTALDF